MRVMALGLRGIPDVQGGVETHALHLYECLARDGCDVEAIVRTPFVPAGRDRCGAIRLTRIWSPRRAGIEALVHSLLGAFYAIARRPDILHIHAIGPAIVTPLARLFGLRVVVTHHGADYERAKWGRFARWVLRTGERFGMRHANARIVISQTIRDQVRRLYQVDSDLIPNGVAPVRDRPGTAGLAPFGLQAGRYFLQVSRMVPEKRQLDLIRAFVESGLARSGWKLALVGKLDHTEYTAAVRSAAQAPGVVLTDFQTGEPLREIYGHAGCFVLPSAHEGLPIAILEALSYGLPVIGSDIAANREVGLPADCYFPLGDAAALAARMIGCAQQPQSEEAAQARREFVRARFDWERIARDTLAVYQRVMST